jgi:adenine-specific DNA-methyltransferase
MIAFYSKQLESNAKDLLLAELIWEKKYDQSGNKSAPVSVPLPFQTIETLNESSQQRQKSIESFLTGRGETEWRNRLIWGDKKYVLPSLVPEFANSVDLIYIDPPFGTGADFSFTASVPEDPDALDEESLVFTKEPSIIEQKAYRDTWGRGLDTYLHWFYETAVLLHDLLNDRGSIYIHLDSGVSHYVKLILDEVFGAPQFVNQIIWRRAFAHNDPSRCGMIHDVLLFYSKTQTRKWNDVLQKPSREYVEQFFDQYDETRKERYERLPLDAPRHGDGGNLVYEWKGVWPAKNRTWAVLRQKMEEYDRAGRIHYPKKGMPRLKRYESEYEGAVLQDIWTDINKIHNQSPELLHYPTQKPEALLDRIIRASSNEGDLVLDCFCGSGTTAAVAEKLGRRWIACDLSRFAIHTTRKRLLSVQNVKPFVIQNLGKYERQAWQTAEFGNETGAKVRSYINFILNLYGAQPLNGYVWLHGKKGRRLVHVGSVDSPISPLDVGQIVAEFKRSIGTGEEAPGTNGVDVLGWDFAFELNEIAKQQARQANVDIRFLRIPREVLDKKAVEQGDVHFFELAALDIRTKASGKKLTVTIKDFAIPPDDVPLDVQNKITHWSQWIDYWAVDWSNKNDTFHNEWQEYRTREKPQLATEVSKTYEKHGEYRIVVKIIDILGNDTTKTIQVKV